MRINLEHQPVHIYGDGLHQAQVSLQTSFMIDARSAFHPDDDVKLIIHPLDSIRSKEVIDHRHGLWKVNYTPNVIGEMYMDIFLGEKLINTEPYRVNVFDVNQINVPNFKDGIVGQLTEFTIDIERAGIGQLDILVQNGRVLCNTVLHSSTKFNVSFLPYECGEHQVDIRFNGLIVPGSPFTCFIYSLPRVIVSHQLSNVPVKHPLSFDIFSDSSLALDIDIITPSNRSIAFQRTQLNENNIRIDYHLDEIGVHRIEIRSNQNMDIYGSPFLLQAYDRNRLVVSDIPRLLIFNQPVEFTVDVSHASGQGQLEVDINDGQVPNQVKTLDNRKFHFTFLPIFNDPHIISIKFDGHQLTGFPKECQVISSENIKIHGPGLHQVLIDVQTWFTLDTSHGGSSDLQVLIFTPTHEQFNPLTLLTSDGLRVDWKPSIVGTYIIHVTLHKNAIPGSPFRVHCYDPKKVLLTPPSTQSIVRKSTIFFIDTSKAGEGDLAVNVQNSNHDIPYQINPLGNHRFEVCFTAQKCTTHYCNILFNREVIPGSPLTVNMMDDKQHVTAMGKGLTSVPIKVPTSFTILTGNHLGEVKCSILGPSGQLISCILTKIDPDRYEVTYIPDRVGEFRIDVLYNNAPINHSPFTSRAFDINQIQILDFPSSTMIGSSTYFTIDASDSGPGNLEISVSKDGRNIPNHVQNEGPTRFRIKFLPDQTGFHQIQVKFNGMDVYGSPFLCHVLSSEFLLENYEYASINKQSSFIIKPRSGSILNTNMSIDIITPSGKEIRAKLERKSVDVYAVPFIPYEIGAHEIRFYENEKKESMFTRFLCQVFDVSQIRVTDLVSARLHQLYKFRIDTSRAGSGILSVKIKQNQNKLSHEQTKISEHIHEISFTPETAEECAVQILFNGEPSLYPLVIPVTLDQVQVHVSSIPVGIVGQPITFTIDNVVDSNLLFILITESHSGRALPHIMTSRSAKKNSYDIAFTPQLARQHTVAISYNDKLTSTTHVDVCNVNKIRVSPMNDGLVGIPLVFSVDTHGAGEGHLEVTISDKQRTLPAELKSVQTRKFDIAFVPELSGLHSIVIAFNGIPIEGSPFRINVRDLSITEKTISETDDDELLIGGQLEGTKVGEVAWLLCETALTDIYEDFQLFVTDPDQVIIKHTRIQDSAERWRIEFEPTKAGIYQIQTKVDDLPMLLASMEILSIDYERNIYGERLVHPNVWNFLSVNSTDEDAKIQLRSSNGKDIPLEIERDLTEWKVYFTLTDIDYYQLSIRADGKEQLFDVHCVTEEIDVVRNGGMEDITRLIIDHTKIITDDVNVIVKDPLAHTIPAAFYRNLNRDLVVEYIPVRTGIHEVFIRTQNNLLDMCPIRLMSFRADTTLEPVLRVQVKELLEHTFANVIDHDNQLDITIMDPFERPIPFRRSKNPRGELTISLSPVRVGTHWIRLSNEDNDSFALLPIFAFDDDYVPLSPVNTPSPDQGTSHPRTNSITDSFHPLPELTTISETSELPSSHTSPTSTVHPVSSMVTNVSPKGSIRSPRSSPEAEVLDIADLTDPAVRISSKFNFKDPNDQFSLVIYDVNGDSIPYKTEHLLDGRKHIFYEPTLVGPVEIHILKNNQSIATSPLIVHAFDPSAVHLLNLPKTIQMNTSTSFLIDPTQAGKGSLKIIIKDSSNRSIPVAVQKQSNGQISVQFEPTVPGSHTISVSFNRIIIPETPLQVLVEEQPAVKAVRLPEIESRGRSIYSKHELLSLAPQHDRPQSLSPQIIHSRLSKSDEIIAPETNSQPSTNKNEDKHQSKSPNSLPNEVEVRYFQSLKEKFERKQPIDTVFDPRPYPFKVSLQHSYPIVNTDMHFSINLPHVAYIHVAMNGTQLPLQAARGKDGELLLKFRPTLAGDHRIVLKDHRGQLLPGCPYIFPVYNPNGIRLESPNYLQPIDDCHLICNIDNIGQGRFFLMIYDQFKPIKMSYQIQSLSTTRFRISLFPTQIGTYRIYLAYRNLPIHGTPVEINVYDIRGISVIAEHTEPVVVRTCVAYKVNTSQAGRGQLKAELIQPQTSKIPCRCHVHDLNSQESLIQYIPSEPGRYQLRLLFNNHLIQGKAFDTNVYSLLPPPSSSFPSIHIHKLFPTDIPRIGDQICLQIITEKPFIHGQVSCNGTSIPCQIERIEDTHTWHLRFRPSLVGTYQIQLLHNGISIQNAPYLIQVKDTDEKKHLFGQINKPCVIQIHTKSALNSQIRADVLLGTTHIPSTTTIVNNHLIRVNFIPQEAGLHAVNLFNKDQLIEGSPFSICVKRLQTVEISGKCLEHLRINDLGIFRIHCHEQHGTIQAKIFNLSAGDRNDQIGQQISFQLLETYEQLQKFPAQIFLTSLTILLTARLRLPQERIGNVALSEENGHAIVSFQLFEVPKQWPSNEQVVHVLRNLIDQQILNLIDPNRRVLHAICGSLTIGPKGEPVTVKLFPQVNGDYMGEFTPRKIGQHRIDVSFANIPIQGSPFFTEVYDPSQVKIGPLPKDILFGIENTFDVHVNNAGNVPLEVIISSPSGVHIPVRIDDLSTIKRVRFKPIEIGLHYLNVKFGSNMLSSIPIKMIVKSTRTITAYGDGLHHASHEKVATFMIDTKDMRGDLDVHIESSNSEIKTTLDRINPGLYQVSYIPVEVGFANINIKWNGNDIPNSPFRAIVTNSEHVRLVGGWQSILDAQNRMRVMVNEEKRIRFDTSHAGPGILKAQIQNENNLHIPVRIDERDSLSSLSFTITREGKYRLLITYASQPLQNMPIFIIASSISSKSLRVEAHGRGLYEARVDEKAEFIIDTTGASNHNSTKPVVRLTGGQTDVEVRIHSKEENRQIYICSYKSTLPGPYLLSISWAEREIRGSPFKVNVLPSLTTNQPTTHVICSGDGLRTGCVGKETTCFIDTRAAHAGELTVSCQGNTTNAFCRLLDHRNRTFTLLIKPEESGKHLLTIKYNGEHVSGSPYSIKVTGASDASKVRVFGPGLEHGVLEKFRSHFLCETKGAGAGQLTVHIRGPKGAFHVEMERDHSQDRSIICRYHPIEPGDYIISIKWSGTHVSGSPFRTRIFQRQEELDQFQQQQNNKL